MRYLLGHISGLAPKTSHAFHRPPGQDLNTAALNCDRTPWDPPGMWERGRLMRNCYKIISQAVRDSPMASGMRFEVF